MNTELTDYHKNIIRESDHLIADLDGTFVRGRISYSSFYLLKDLAGKGKVIDSLKGLAEGIRIYFKTPWGEWEAENWGLRALHRVLEGSEISEEEIRKSAKTYLEKRQIRGAKDCFDAVRSFGKKKKTLLVTRALYPWSSEANRYLKFDEYISNVIKFKDNKVDEIQITMEKPEDKFRLIREKVRNTGNSVMITNNPEDLQLKPELALIISSPTSNGRLKEESHLHISNYEEFNKALSRKQ
jgi:phosphoserine phosphatase